jgi:hypothetical protein
MGLPQTVYGGAGKLAMDAIRDDECTMERRSMPKPSKPKKDIPLLIDDDVLYPFHPPLAILLGLNEAIFLHQLNFDAAIKGKYVLDGRTWFHGTYEYWHGKLPFFAISTIRRLVERLEDTFCLYTAIPHADEGDNLKWYSINYEALRALYERANSLIDAHSQRRYEDADHWTEIRAITRETYDESVFANTHQLRRKP